MADQFKGPILKVERAKRHINELESLIESFLKTDVCNLHVEVGPDSENYILKLDSVAKTPPEIALAIGDTVHNLRSAMDHVAFVLLGAIDPRIAFPAGKERDDLIGTPAYRSIQKALPNLANFIADTIKPCEGGDYSVWEIVTLDNMDKHRLIVPVISVYALTGVCCEDERQNRFVNTTLGVMEGGTLRAISTPTPIKITDYGNPAAHVLFGEGTPASGKPILPTLAEYAELTIKAVQAIQKFHFG